MRIAESILAMILAAFNQFLSLNHIVKLSFLCETKNWQNSWNRSLCLDCTFNEMLGELLSWIFFHSEGCFICLQRGLHGVPKNAWLSLCHYLSMLVSLACHILSISMCPASIFTDLEIVRKNVIKADIIPILNFLSIF